MHSSIKKTTSSYPRWKLGIERIKSKSEIAPEVVLPEGGGVGGEGERGTNVHDSKLSVVFYNFLVLWCGGRGFVGVQYGNEKARKRTPRG
jgi:hypothetical protein